MRTLCLIALAAASTLVTRAGNLGFETPGFVDWTVVNTQIGLITHTGGRDIVTGSAPAGSLAQVSSAFAWGGNNGPVEGSLFADLVTGNTQYFDGTAPGNPSRYTTSVSQTLSLGAGDTLSGWAAFVNGDTIAQDRAFVTVTDLLGNAVSLWSAVSGGSSYFPHLPSPWTEWSFTAPVSGNFLLSMGITSGGDNQQSSAAMFDGITIRVADQIIDPPSAITVPDSASTLALLGSVMLGFIGSRRIRPYKR